MKDFEPYDTIGHNFLCHLRKSKTGPISSKKSRTFVPVVPREVFAVANRIVVQGRLVNNALHAVGAHQPSHLTPRRLDPVPLQQVPHLAIARHPTTLELVGLDRLDPFPHVASDKARFDGVRALNA